MIINAENIKVAFGKKEILRGINLSAGKNEFIGIIGPNGSGKSTLLKCLYRVIADYAGVVYLDGKDLEEYPYRESAQKISVVAQHNFFSFDFKVMDMLLMGRAPYKNMFDRDTEEDYEIAEKALGKVGLVGFGERLFSTLSGGEQQRVVLARALCQDTPILILDEPTNHLDINYQILMMNILKSLDKTIISAIHNLDAASIYCDRIFMMNEGKIVASGTPQEVLTKEMINKVYQVHADIFTDQYGRHRIMFSPEVAI